MTPSGAHPDYLPHAADSRSKLASGRTCSVFTMRDFVTVDSFWFAEVRYEYSVSLFILRFDEAGSLDGSAMLRIVMKGRVDCGVYPAMLE
jgi:hypothetical protein